MTTTAAGNPLGTNAGGTNPLGTNAGGTNPFGSWSPGGYDAQNKRAVDVRFMPTVNECATTSCASRRAQSGPR